MGNSVNARVLVKPKNMVLSHYYFVDYGTELFYSACCTCSKIIFYRSTNQILNLCSFRRSYCHRCDEAPDKLLRLLPTVIKGNQSYTQEVWLRDCYFAQNEKFCAGGFRKFGAFQLQLALNSLYDVISCGILRENLPFSLARFSSYTQDN